MTPAAAPSRVREVLGVLGNGVQRAVRALGPIGRVLRMGTSLGWGVLLCSLTALLLGVLLGWAEFMAAAVVGALLLVLAVPYVLGRARYTVRMELASSRVVVGEQAVGRLVIRNIAGSASPAAWMMLPVGAVRARVRVPRLGADAEHDELLSIPTSRRAVLTIGPATSLRGDPLGLLQHEQRWGDATELYIHPRTVSLLGDTTGLVRDLEGLPTRDLADDDISFHALREYTPGDDLRHVHWKATARTQTLMIRQFEQTRRSQLVVALSTRADEYADEDEFELAVSIAASVAVSAMREGKDVIMLAGADAIDEPTPGRLLDRIAAIERSETAQPSESLGQIVAAQMPSASVVMFVTGVGVELPRLNTAALRVPVTAQSAALRAAARGELARRAIGGLTAVDVPELDSLRAAIRAVSA
ncbi:DUF58 domain-containing protein [Microbacterium suwonense]|uniref:DUF58 domain-containing protein n=1 Tax=Microbacterium suwonense TaxID=683047 RepID=A0ABN6X4D2_9MICO|nr:DUF58 domain-containing protein [Microbacterium suwonense]BDZ39635.1 hypothetical protein GCM10025863_22490 [Microbacterium suwonense]